MVSHRILDAVVESGEPVEIVRKGVVLRIAVAKTPSKLARLKKRDVFVGDPDDILRMNWLDGWSEKP
ncbi:MAG: type II toxin-antitoxin system Phd/YefM family antitoxin [Bryobacterales bacterium]|nr:type II toxin-antitoxin system Phd/YefM family antitoxin [Bryobacterales bacterium]